MNWLAHHIQSEKYIAQAEELSKHEGDRASHLYLLAAKSEANALNALDSTKTRTIGITAVSAVSLYIKASEFSQAKNLAQKWLESGLLPGFAVKQLQALLQIIENCGWKTRPSRTALHFVWN